MIKKEQQKNLAGGNIEKVELKREEGLIEKPKEVLDKKSSKELKKIEREAEIKKNRLESWEPKTKLGQEVKAGKIKDIDEILNSGKKILEEEIADYLLNLKIDLISIGQSKGKFGGGKRRAWKQTQRKTEQKSVLKFSAMAVVGDENGHVGVGEGSSNETLPARDKAMRQARLNIFKITRTCSAFDCACSEPHTVPFKVIGKSGSVRVKLIPAPQGIGLVVASELKKILKMAGIKDVYSRTSGKTKTTFNLIKACVDALKKTNLRIK